MKLKGSCKEFQEKLGSKLKRSERKLEEKLKCSCQEDVVHHSSN